MNNDSPHDILLLLGRMEGKLDAVIKSMDKLDSAISSLDQRVSTLEKAHARFKGGAAFLLALVSAAAVLLRYAHRE
jgi:uncharacterized protein YhaN